jgi:hypothetical protein
VVAALAAEMARRYAPKLVINKGNQLFPRGLVPLAPGVEQRGDGLRSRRDHVRPSCRPVFSAGSQESLDPARGEVNQVSDEEA